MAGKQEIEFVIKPDGTVEEKVIGVSGPDCEKITADIEKALGEVIDRERTSDYFNGNSVSTDDAVSSGV
ncbi:MAG: DUF2997 domain-containing protein [Chloroflexi bacterium]|nr:DUF2997 domain-containing protein [Chloroflexota bacterium]